MQIELNTHSVYLFTEQSEVYITFRYKHKTMTYVIHTMPYVYTEKQIVICIPH